MTLRPGWPAVSGAASQFDIRAGLRATVAQDAAGNVKTGVAVNAQTQSALVSARTDMKVDVAAFDAVLDRYGPVFVRHEGVDQVTLTAAPTANQRIDSVWVRQQETASPVSDAANGPVFGVAKGTASTSPVAPAIPAGAMRLADVQIPSTATATNSSGVTITQRYDFTAAQGAPLTFRTKTDLQAWAGWDGQKARVIADPTVANNGDYVRSAGVWVRNAVADVAITQYWGNGGTTGLKGVLAGGAVTLSGGFNVGATGVEATTIATLAVPPREAVRTVIAIGPNEALMICNITTGGLLQNSYPTKVTGDFWIPNLVYLAA